MFDYPSHGLSDHPCDRRGHHLLTTGMSLVKNVSFHVVDPLDQVGLVALTLGSKGRIGGCNIF